jgi:DNA-binding transcriptional LysR family regulator
MTIHIRQLLTLREVARLGSINAAALAMHTSQPAVTQSVAEFERSIGTRLFERHHAGVRVNEAGRLFTDRIERALDHLLEGLGDSPRNMQGSSRVKRTELLRRVTRGQLTALNAVVKHRSFVLAAGAERVAHSTLHRSTRELERRLGMQLFERTSFGIMPTADAERLALRTRLAASEIDQAVAEAHALAGGKSGRTVIGAMPLARSFLLPTALLDFSADYPQHNVSIMDGTYDHLLGALRAAEADFLIGAMRETTKNSDIVQEHLFDDPLSIVMRAGHPLTKKKKVSTAVLARHSWIAARSGSPLHQQFERLFTARGIKPPPIHIECNSLITSRALLMESDRLMMLSSHEIHYELAAGLLAVMPHPDGKVARQIGLTMRKDWQPTRAQQRLLELVRRRCPRS